MKIKDILQKKRTISCEFYPPREADAIPGVFRAIDRISPYNLDFVSVTYGAGGSTRDFTEQITRGVKTDTEVEDMAHLPCVGQTKEEVHDVLQRMDAIGIGTVITLRGDPRSGQTDCVPVERGFGNATELLEHIRQSFDFGLAGA